MRLLPLGNHLLGHLCVASIFLVVIGTSPPDAPRIDQSSRFRAANRHSGTKARGQDCRSIGRFSEPPYAIFKERFDLAQTPQIGPL